MFKATFGERTFTLDKLTLGDWRTLKREFGLTAESLIDGNDENGRLRLEDADVLVGLLVCALRQERPDAPVGDLIAEVESLNIEDFEVVPEEAEAEPDPQTAADDAATGSKTKGKGRAQATPRKTSGSQR